MLFAEKLLGPESAEALELRLEEEIKILEHMREFLWKRAAVELEYSSNLARINESIRAHRVDCKSVHGGILEVC